MTERRDDDGSQILVPESFLALFMPPGRARPVASMAHVIARYELCEDLAQMLTEQAVARVHALGVTESDVLVRIGAGLLAGDVVEEAEARWVLRRLSELLDWPFVDPAQLS